MPLIKSASKKAFQKNVETEMHANPDPKDRAQNLAISYSIQRKSKKKKMAEGGYVNDSAKTEERPMPEEKDQDSQMVSRNSGKKALKDADWTGAPQDREAVNSRPRVQPMKHPKSVPSNAFSTRLYNKEGKLEESEAPNDGPQEQPEQDYNEEDASKSGPSVPDMQAQHNNGRKPYAKGGSVGMEYGSKPEEDNQEDPNGLEEDDDQKRPSQDEYMAGHFVDGGEVSSPSLLDKIGSAIDNATGNSGSAGKSRYDSWGASSKAEGGMIDSMDQPNSEHEDEQHDSIAAAIMAKRDRMHAMIDSGAMDEDRAVKGYYEGGQIEGSDESQVDLDLNSMEQPNKYYPRNEDEVLKENYNSEINKMSQPEDSNEHGDKLSDEDAHDMVDQIRRKMKSRKQF